MHQYIYAGVKAGLETLLRSMWLASYLLSLNRVSIEDFFGIFDFVFYRLFTTPCSSRIVWGLSGSNGTLPVLVLSTVRGLA